MPNSMDAEDLIDMLLQIPLFGNLDSTQLSQIINACEWRDVQPGRILCKPQTIDERLFIPSPTGF